jgi:hypothetical protein
VKLISTPEEEIGCHHHDQRKFVDCTCGVQDTGHLVSDRVIRFAISSHKGKHFEGEKNGIASECVKCVKKQSGNVFTTSLNVHVLVTHSQETENWCCKQDDEYMVPLLGCYAHEYFNPYATHYFSLIC